MAKKENEKAEAANVVEQTTPEVVVENATTETTAETVETVNVENNKEAANVENIDAVEVPENAEEISNDEALKLAADEVNKLREENTVLKAQLDEATQKLQAVEETVGKLEEKLKAAAAGNGGNNEYYIELLAQFDAKIDEYAGLRRERLRKEFIIDLKEEIQRQKDLLKNA